MDINPNDRLNETNFSPEEQRKIDMDAAAFAKALQMHDKEKALEAERRAREEEENYVPPVPLEPYHEKYFFVRMFRYLVGPVCLFLFLVLSSFLLYQALVRVGSDQADKVILAAGLSILVSI